MFVDESGFYLLPRRWCAPTPRSARRRCSTSSSRASTSSAISAITEEGKLYMMEQDRALKGSDVVRFLEHLLRQIAGKLLVVWDGSPRSIGPKP